jgi:glycosyltransferase involved in cell wall biosynthesis
MPRVTICLPVYNCENTIAASLTSALAQTHEDFDCLVVDNASTDSTFELVTALSDARIRVVRNRENIGPNPNHNRCIELAQGDLIQFLHSDDLLLPNCLSRLAPAFDNPRVGLAFARRRIEPPDTEWAVKYATLHTPLEPLSSVNDGMGIVRRYVNQRSTGNWIGEPTSVMVRRSVLLEVGGFSPELRYCDDIELWLRVLARSDAAWVDEELSVRRHNEETLTANYFQNDSAWLDRLWVLSELARNRDLERRLRVRARRQWVVTAAKKVVRATQAPREVRASRYGQLMRHFRCSLRPAHPEFNSGRYLHTR